MSSEDEEYGGRMVGFGESGGLQLVCFVVCVSVELPRPSKRAWSSFGGFSRNLGPQEAALFPSNFFPSNFPSNSAANNWSQSLRKSVGTVEGAIVRTSKALLDPAGLWDSRIVERKCEWRVGGTPPPPPVEVEACLGEVGREEGERGVGLEVRVGGGLEGGGGVRAKPEGEEDAVGVTVGARGGDPTLLLLPELLLALLPFFLFFFEERTPTIASSPSQPL